MTTAAVREVLGRDYKNPTPNTANCSQHMGVPLLERSIDCPMCSYDLKEFIRAACDANRWLNEWRDAMVAALQAKSDAVSLPHVSVTEQDPFPAEMTLVNVDEGGEKTARYVRLGSPRPVA